MPFDDLDLEFEDEEESKKKKKEAVDVDVDLDFTVAEGSKPRSQAQPQRPPSGGMQSSVPRPSTPGQPAQVRKIDDARVAQAQVKRPGGVPQGIPPQPRVVGSSAIKEEGAYDLESQQVVEMREQMRKLEIESQVKVAVAEFKTDYLTEMLSDLKLAEHQINQLLIRINAKHPDMKNEVLMIKKILADFNAKKRK
jgi:hypothetical protein